MVLFCFWLLQLLTAVAALLFLYHHFVYPKLLAYLANRRAESNPVPTTGAIQSNEPLSFITVILPCYNEQAYIAEKMFNFAFIEYPHHLLKVIVADDGSTDSTAAIYQQTVRHPLLAGISFELRSFGCNRGKIAVLNDLLTEPRSGLVCLSDVSALISADAFLLINRHMRDHTIGAVAASYGLLNPGSEGEAAYWRYQVEIKRHESLMGSTLGVHGALYCLRPELFQRLDADSINDDFMIPMHIIEQGYRVIYDTNIVGVELEQSTAQLDFHRRSRIAAGNVQQVLRLKTLLHPKYGSVAFNFFSGKFLRVMMPWCMVLMLVGSAVLAITSPFFALALLFQGVCYAGAGYVQVSRAQTQPKVLRLLHYLVTGHYASLVGWGLLFRRSDKVLRWRKSNNSQVSDQHYLPAATRYGKRAFDLVVASVILIMTLPLWLLIALAIRMTSAGPIFYRQLRIGYCDGQQTHLFYMIKFRTMVHDAERLTGAVWSGKNDPRITKLGRFLRKSRLDELPQMINVCCGDMSLVGPRPERPELCHNIEQEIPYFSERTCYVRPGITGLAQVYLGYDTCIDDVRKKVMYDHSYALALHTTRSWLKMDCCVLVRTVYIMLAGRGQ